MAKRDYYDVLEADNGSDAAALKKAYRRKVKELHPDQNQDNPNAEEQFKEVNEAYDILKDPEKKAAYDRYGHAAFEGGTGAALAEVSIRAATAILAARSRMYLTIYLVVSQAAVADAAVNAQRVVPICATIWALRWKRRISASKRRFLYQVRCPAIPVTERVPKAVPSQRLARPVLAWGKSAPSRVSLRLNEVVRPVQAVAKSLKTRVELALAPGVSRRTVR